MQSILRTLLFLFLVFQTSLVFGDFKIEGRINMKGNWQYQIYLSTIDKLDDYYDANASSIIKVSAIDPSGHFIIEGDNLPESKQFYRLYLIKEEHSEFNACLFVGGEEHNFIHLLLDNQSQLRIEADTNAYAPFGNYSITGNKEMQQLRSLGELVYPSYIFYEIKFPSELKFSQDKLNRDLFQFADTCSSTLVSLAALNNTDIDSYIGGYYDHYLKLGNTLQKEYPKHPYTEDYFRKMRYFDEDFDKPTLGLSRVINLLLISLASLLFIRNIQLRRRLNKDKKPDLNQTISLTNQEEKILELIQMGKSNKEIASELFIELSTVKTHINKLYAKIKVKNRKEAQLISLN